MHQLIINNAQLFRPRGNDAGRWRMRWHSQVVAYQDGSRWKIDTSE